MHVIEKITKEFAPKIIALKMINTKTIINDMFGSLTRKAAIQLAYLRTITLYKMI